MAKKKPSSSSPPHLRTLGLLNFRGFKRAKSIPLRPLTFLVGPNSSGKSSLFDALLLMAQSKLFRSWREPCVPRWTGDLVDLGSYRDSVYNHNPKLPMSIQVEFIRGSGPMARPSFREGQHSGPVHLDFRLRSSTAEPDGSVVSATIQDITSGQAVEFSWSRARQPKLTVKAGDKKTALSEQDPKRPWALERRIVGHLSKLAQLSRPRSPQRKAWNHLAAFVDSVEFPVFCGTTERVSSGRSAPRRTYPAQRPAPRLGFRAVSPTLFDAVDPIMIEALERKGRARKHGKERGLQRLVDILKQLDIADGITPSKLSAYHSAILVTDNKTGVQSHLIDVGYGASQVIPVIAGCLSQAPGLLLVEQPEIHLHPKAQGVIAELLCHTSKTRQVIVETHAVHMINRARIMIARGDLNADDVMVNFVLRDKKGSHVQPIPLTADGDFDAEWPDGFFDERYQDTMELLRLSGKRSN